MALIQIRSDKSLKNDFNVATILRGTCMSEVARLLIKDWLNNQDFYEKRFAKLTEKKM